MIVTDKKYYMDNRLLEKLDLMVNRCSGKIKLDNLVIVDGDEGYGKSTLAVSMAYYVAYKLGRPFSVNNIFFNTKDLINFAKSTKEQVIIWDEATLGGLAAEWYVKDQIKLIKLLNIVRKKKHFFFFNIPKFFKLNETLVIDRSIALVHVYARNDIELGRFVYFRRTAKENLFNDWRRKRLRNYRKYYTLRGSFVNALPKIIDEQEYEDRKDKMIETFDEEDKKIEAKDVQLLMFQYKISNLDKAFPQLRVVDIIKYFDIGERSIYDWRKLPKKHPFLSKRGRLTSIVKELRGSEL